MVIFINFNSPHRSSWHLNFLCYFLVCIFMQSTKFSKSMNCLKRVKYLHVALFSLVFEIGTSLYQSVPLVLISTWSVPNFCPGFRNSVQSVPLFYSDLVYPQFLASILDSEVVCPQFLAWFSKQELFCTPSFDSYLVCPHFLAWFSKQGLVCTPSFDSYFVFPPKLEKRTLHILSQKIKLKRLKYFW